MSNRLKVFDLIDQAKKENLDIDFSQLQPFVFSENSMDLNKIEKLEPVDDDEILSTPFDLFSIESDKGGLISGLSKESGINCIVQCVVIKEKSLGVYDFFALIFIDGLGKLIEFKNDFKSYEEKSEARQSFFFLQSIIKTYLSRLNKEKSGLITNMGRTKYKLNGKKYIYKPNKIIYISKKEYAQTDGNYTHKIIDWKHSWSVRGHWRKLTCSETMGKSKTGERTVKGYTWIDQYQKGDGILSPTKIRKV